MNIDLILGLLAVLAFFLAAIGKDEGHGIPVGLLLLTLVVIF
jgi:hypothetical protein